MSYKTVEVELDKGRVRPVQGEVLPDSARALLTVLEPLGVPANTFRPSTGSGLKRFLSTPDFPLTPEQFHSSMDSDVFEQ